MRRYWVYFKYIIRHKWFVFLACRRLGIPLWRAIMHDMSKFSYAEFGPYARSFYNADGSKRRASADKDKITQDFSYAWNHHEKHNPHHWGYWLIASGDYGKVDILPMPITYIKEMVADWAGAGKAINGKGNPYDWYDKNGAKFVYHPETRGWLEVYLNQLNCIAEFYDWF